MRRLTLLLAVLAALPVPAAAAAPALHASRGAHTAYGNPEFGEETMSAFRPAFRAWGAVVAVDARLTGDGVPVAMRDATLDRTTDCTGPVAGRTLAGLAGCRVDVVGSPGGPLGSRAAACTDAVPTLAEVLGDAGAAGATVSVEIPSDAPGTAEKVMDVVTASGLPKERLLIRSAAPQNLDVAEARLPGVPQALVTDQASNAGGPALASTGGYEWVSPEWPVDAAYVGTAHGLGLAVVPYTLDDADQVRAAAALAVDALLTDDVGMARRALGLPDGADPLGLVCAAPVVPRPRPPASPGPPEAELLVPTLASDAYTGPRMRLRWRGRGTDDARAAAFLAEVRPAASRREEDWRTLVAGALRRDTIFTGAPGATFVLRVRARDALGTYGPAAARAVTVPLDDASGRLTRSGPWRRVRSPGAWRGRVSASASPRARLGLRFGGRRLRVIARRGPAAGRLTVAIDGRTRVVPTAGRAGARAVVFDSGPLRAGRHRLALRPAGGGRVEIDAVAPG